MVQKDVSLYIDQFPGDIAFGSTQLPDAYNMTRVKLVGAGANGAAPGSTLMDFLSGAGHYAAAPFVYAYNAAKETVNAPRRAAHFVAQQEEAVKHAALGIESAVKWLVVGLVALAVIYVSGLVSPLVPRR